MKNIKELELSHSFIVADKFIAIKNGVRNVVKLQSKYFSSYPLLFVVIKGVRYQVSDKVFTFDCGTC